MYLGTRWSAWAVLSIGATELQQCHVWKQAGVIATSLPALIPSSALLCATHSSEERWHLYSGRIN